MRGSREISLVPSLHRASTDALIDLCRYATDVSIGNNWQLVSDFVPQYIL